MDNIFKRILIIAGICTALGIIIGVHDYNKIIYEKMNTPYVSDTNNIVVYEKANCDREKELYYTDVRGNNYYTSCLNKIYVTFDNNQIELKEALNTNKITFNEIYKMVSKPPVLYYDGGSKVYEYGNFSILRCNRLADLNSDGKNNIDVIIGTKDLDINDDYCYKNFDDAPKGECRFTRTYLINEITDLVTDDYTEVIVSQIHGGIAKVKIENRIIPYLKENKYFEFSFDNYNDVKLYESKDNIQFIFENYYLGSYGETERTILNQIQEPICQSE